MRKRTCCNQESKRITVTATLKTQKIDKKKNKYTMKKVEKRGTMEIFHLSQV